MALLGRPPGRPPGGFPCFGRVLAPKPCRFQAKLLYPPGLHLLHWSIGLAVHRCHHQEFQLSHHHPIGEHPAFSLSCSTTSPPTCPSTTSPSTTARATRRVTFEETFEAERLQDAPTTLGCTISTTSSTTVPTVPPSTSSFSTTNSSSTFSLPTPTSILIPSPEAKTKMNNHATVTAKINLLEQRVAAMESMPSLVQRLDERCHQLEKALLAFGKHVGALYQQYESLHAPSSCTSPSPPTLLVPPTSSLPTPSSPQHDERRVHDDTEKESNSDEAYTDDESVDSSSSTLHWRVRAVYLARGMDMSDLTIWSGKMHKDTQDKVRRRRRRKLIFENGKDDDDGNNYGGAETMSGTAPSVLRGRRRRKQKPRPKPLQ